MNPIWTVITVTYNSAPEIHRNWVPPRPAGVEWIVVDNASTDGSADAARSVGADLVVELGVNTGFSAANNHGLERARGRYVLFANPDLAIDYTDLPALAAAIDDGGGLVSPQLLNPDGTPQPNGRGFPTLVNKVLNRTVRGSHDRYRIYAAPGEAPFVCFAIGAAVAGGRDQVLAQLGGWDDYFFVYYEDSDLGLRAWEAGMPVRLLGDVRWVHEWKRETARLAWRPWLLELGSMIRFYRRYPHLLGSQQMARRRFPSVAYQVLASHEGVA